MADAADDAQKTEEPTHRKLEEAFKKGQIVTSRDVQHVFSIATLTLLIIGFIPDQLKKISFLLRGIIENAAVFTYGIEMQTLLYDLTLQLLILMMPLFLAMMGAGLASALIQNPFHITLDPLMPKAERISPFAGFKRLFSMKSLVEIIKGVLKISLIGYVAFLAVKKDLPVIYLLHDQSMNQFMRILLSLITHMMINVSIVIFIIGAIDYFHQRYNHMKMMRMTKQEIKDEMKNSEGNPEIKAKIRSLRNERARKRMMNAIPKADVLITNPIHYAIALKYDTQTMEAPIVTAKGIDDLALRISDIARKHNVPIVRNPVIARALYDVPIDGTIPKIHYKAVAAIIRFVYQLKGRKVG